MPSGVPVLGYREPPVVYPRINPMERFDEQRFLSRYRLDKAFVRNLSVAFQCSGYCRTQCTNVTAEERMCLALRYYATGGDYKLIGDFQGVTKSLVSKSVHDVTEFLYAYQQRFIDFPFSEDERYASARDFYRNFEQKPCVFGCIDGTHIAIKSPSRDTEYMYVNRKQYHSLNVLVISDANKKIIHIDPRWPGSCNDAMILRSSEVCEMGDRGEFGNFFLLGDGGYPIKDYLMVPVPNPTTQEEYDFNRWHRSTRTSVEHTFGVWKQRFRALDTSGGYLYHTPSFAAKVIIACACLHNAARDRRLEMPPDTDMEVDGFRPVHLPREQPPTLPAAQARRQYNLRRATYIRNNFGQRE